MAYDYVTTTGTVVPDTSTLQAEVEAEYRAALGADIVVTANTPQGALITAEVIARTGVIGNNAALANQINPNLAGGVFLDAIWALTGGQRLAATWSVVPGVALTGLPGVVVPAGSQAALADGTIFESVSGVVLNAFGAGTVDFQAVDPGPIAVSVGALNRVVTGILGWDSVTNPVAATLGRDEESDLDSRQRRRNTLSLQNVALPEAITSALYDTPNVRSLTFRENTADVAQVINSITLAPHSIFVCVDGGTDADVAAALLATKSLGCDWNGTTTVNVTDPVSGQVYPVRFTRPAVVNVQARVTVRNIGALADIPGTVRQAVLDYAAGLLPGEAGLVVGENVSAFEFGGAVARQVPGVQVVKCEISLVTPTVWSTDEIAIRIDQIAAIIAGNITVLIV
jgi:Baseplate J-like protein